MKGVSAEIGDTRVAQNGYHYTRTKLGWELTHRIIAADKLGRALTEDERAVFNDGNRRNLSPDNIQVVVKKRGTKAARRTALVARIEQLQIELAELDLE
jgi:hypothetical protein